MKILSVILALMLLPAFAFAQTGGFSLTPAQEQRAEMLGSQLRCLVCQNENIENSLAPLAGQLRQITRQKIAEGESNEQIRRYMVQRYGVFILLKPPVSSLTWLLYGMPILALLAGLGLFYLSRYRQSTTSPLPLTKLEQDRLDELLK